jgi:hypothetical protein
MPMTEELHFGKSNEQTRPLAAGLFICQWPNYRSTIIRCFMKSKIFSQPGKEDIFLQSKYFVIF